MNNPNAMKIPEDAQADLLETIGMDHGAFSHQVEAYRDSVLAGATKVDFGLYGLDSGLGAGIHYADNPAVVKRYIAGNDRGMTEEILRDVYAKVARSATTQMLELVATEDGLTTELHPFKQSEAGLHKRRGLGGRMSLTGWNRMGLIVVTIRDGVPLMLWIYTDNNGRLATRDFGGTPVVAPYVESEFLHIEDMRDDPHFFDTLAARSKLDDDAMEQFQVLGEELVLDNPLFGYDWSQIVPDWVADDTTEDLWTLNGEPANGTVKFLMGDHVDSSTGYTGNPAYPAERKSYEYAGYMQQNMVDLTAADLTINVLQQQTPSKLRASDKAYRVAGANDELVYATKNVSIVGLYPHRHNAELVLDEIVDLTGGGSECWDVRAWVSVVAEGTSVSRYGQSSHLGSIKVAYGNEIGKDLTKDYNYRNLGVSTMSKFHSRVSILFIPPLVGEGVPGVRQTLARDSIVWHGTDDGELPVKQWINALRGQDVMKRVAALAPSFDGDSDTVQDNRMNRKAAEILNFRKNSDSGADRPARKPAVLEDAAGKTFGKGDDVQSESNPDNPREACDECDSKQHLPTCSKYVEPVERPDAEPTGTLGKRRRGKEAKDGWRARKSKAKRNGDSNDSGSEITFEKFPKAVVLKKDDWLNGYEGVEKEQRKSVVAEWAIPPDIKEDAGIIHINRDHPTIKGMYSGIRSESKQRDRSEVDNIVTEGWQQKFVQAWIEHVSLSLECGADLTDAQRSMTDPNFWMLVAEVGFVAHHDSLKSRVAHNAARRAA